MNAKKCDACGKLYENYGTRGNHKRANGIMLIHNKFNSHLSLGVLDLCEGCMEKVKDFLNIKNHTKEA